MFALAVSLVLHSFFFSFSTVPGSNESDLRTLYCAFAISSMLDDWSGVDVPRAVSFISTCRVMSSSTYTTWYSPRYNRLTKAAMANHRSVKHKVFLFDIPGSGRPNSCHLKKEVQPTSQWPLLH